MGDFLKKAYDDAEKQINDRFKFRVWDKGLNQYNKFKSYVLFEDGELGEYDSVTPVQEWYVIEQCTGLKDKNGNLIYENDRIKVRNEPGIIHLGFYRKTDEHFDGIYGWYIDWDKNPCWLRQDLGYFITEGIEIIGNIHEQKE